jgi:exodeoxyribonuclease-3
LKQRKIVSWNVNGIRAVHKKGFLSWLTSSQPDILCLQETKADPDQIPTEIRSVSGYTTVFPSLRRKGYAGVGLLSQEHPAKVDLSLDADGFDDEGRVIRADYGTFILLNIYFPNGKASSDRLSYKMRFYDELLFVLDRMSDMKRKVVICGDFNTAHKEIDLARPKQNEKVSGFLPEERAWMDKLVSHGFVDTFRILHEGSGHYSWWDLKSRSRDRNIGWRIDYFFVSENMSDDVSSASIFSDVMGSDHCPIGIVIDVS